MKQRKSEDRGVNPPGRANPGYSGVRGGLSVLLALGIAGCGSLDRDFRSRVGEVDVEAANSFDDENAGISDQSSVGVDFKLRDPGDGKEILPATYGK
jgi:hypothetical protein